VEPVHVDPRGVLDVDGELFDLQIEERNKRIDHVLTADELRDKKLGQRIYPPRYDYIPRGVLSLAIEGPEGSYESKTITETKTLKLEDRIQEMLMTFWRLAQSIKAARKRKRQEEADRRRREIEALKARERRKAHGILIAELEREAGAWHRAQYLRRYVRAAKRALGERQVGMYLGDKQVDFMEWAEAYIEQLDPLSETPKNSELIPPRNDYEYSSDEKRLANLHRLIGNDWIDSSKLLFDEAQEEHAATPGEIVIPEL
jgi:hypothetical protein